MDYKKFFYDKSKDDFGPGPPVECYDAINKCQVDALADDVMFCESCKAVLEIYGLFGVRPIIDAIVDGQPLQKDDNILVLDYTYPQHNGIYKVHETIYYNRNIHASLNKINLNEFSQPNHCLTYVTAGDTYADTLWMGIMSDNEWRQLEVASESQ